jgi:hypothetical protein
MKIDPKKADLIEALCLKTKCSLSDENQAMLASLPLRKLEAVVKIAIDCYDSGCDVAAKALEEV